MPVLLAIFLAVFLAVLGLWWLTLGILGFAGLILVTNAKENGDNVPCKQQQE